MERIMKAQALGDNKNMMFMQGRKILEINPEHKLIQKLKTIVDDITSAQKPDTVEPDASAQEKEPDASIQEAEQASEPIQEAEQAPVPPKEPHPLSDKGKDITNLLYDVALLHAGFTIDNMSSFSEKLYGLVV
jgi:HSP90 family molecular chaperone